MPLANWSVCENSNLREKNIDFFRGIKRLRISSDFYSASTICFGVEYNVIWVLSIAFTFWLDIIMFLPVVYYVFIRFCAIGPDASFLMISIIKESLPK